MSVPIINGNVDAALTRWVENANDDAPYAFILRLYTLQDTHAKETIGTAYDTTYDNFVANVKGTLYCVLKNHHNAPSIYH